MDYILGYWLAPVCLVLAYKRILNPRMWINVPVFFAAPGAYLFLQISEHRSLLLAAIGTFAFFALFAALAYAGAWAEDRFVAPHKLNDD
ncbi:MAG: hypothetical protein JJT88_19630 [Gammaproteobacteria bacterium]|nr:hypothetical protein [Gammaproteobacteria bacterium]